jgi:transcriptional regulator with XRE-family HTH domain
VLKLDLPPHCVQPYIPDSGTASPGLKVFPICAILVFPRLRFRPRIQSKKQPVADGQQVKAKEGRLSTPISNRLEMPESSKIDLLKLGQKVRFLRQGKGWTLSDIAEKSGVSKAYVSDLENGVAGKPNIQYIYSIAVALDVSLDGLLSDTAARPSSAKRKEKHELPPGLWELQQEKKLTDDDVEVLATINFRGNRPRDREGWLYLLNTLKLLGQRPSKK